MLVESEDKKGNKIRTLEFVPVYLAKEMEKSEDAAIRYCVEKLELKNPDIRVRKIKMDLGCTFLQEMVNSSFLKELSNLYCQKNIIK